MRHKYILIFILLVSVILGYFVFLKINFPHSSRVSDPLSRYSLEIPTGWYYKVIKPNTLEMAPISEKVFKMFLTLEPNPDQLNINDYYDGDPGIDLFGQSPPPVIGNINGVRNYRFIPWATEAGTAIVIFPLENAFLVVEDGNWGYQENGMFQRILESIRFSKS